MIPDDIGREDFAAAGVDIARAHGVGNIGDGIFHTAVPHVVGVEVGVVLGIVAGHDGILETGSLEGGVPVLHTLLHDVAPLLGEGTVDVEDNRLLGLNQLASEVGFAILVLRFEPPAVDVLRAVYAVLVARVDVFGAREETHPTVVDAGAHGLLGQKYQRAVHGHGADVVAGEAEHRANLAVLRETLGSQDVGVGRGVGARLYLGRGIAGHGADNLLVGLEEVAHVHHHVLAVLGLDFEGLDDGVAEVLVERSGNGVVLVDDVAMLHQVHEERLLVLAEANHKGVGGHLAGHEELGVGGSGHPAREQEDAVHQRVGHLDQQFVFGGQMQGEHALLRLGSLDELVVFRLFGGRIGHLFFLVLFFTFPFGVAICGGHSGNEEGRKRRPYQFLHISVFCVCFSIEVQK